MQVHLDAMKDTHLHLACKGVATLTETIQEQAPKMLFWKIIQKSWNVYRIAPLSGKYRTFHRSWRVLKETNKG